MRRSRRGRIASKSDALGSALFVQYVLEVLRGDESIWQRSPAMWAIARVTQLQTLHAGHEFAAVASARLTENASADAAAHVSLRLQVAGAKGLVRIIHGHGYIDSGSRTHRRAGWNQSLCHPSRRWRRWQRHGHKARNDKTWLAQRHGNTHAIAMPWSCAQETTRNQPRRKRTSNKHRITQLFWDMGEP